MDACTGWPDGWPTWLGGTGTEWQHCCAAHDVAYASEPGLFGYLQAHLDLAQCVGSVSWGMAATMFIGLVTFGSAVIINRKNRYGRK